MGRVSCFGAAAMLVRDVMCGVAAISNGYLSD
jgi:hypothetical protein